MEWPDVTRGATTDPTDFAQALREHRNRRRLSQLELAMRAGTTQRHLSFLESGRSEPGRDMVVRLAESLDLPLRERNSLLIAAGFTPAYPRTALDDPAMATVQTALRRILAGHLPYPAIIVDSHGDLVTANTAFDLLTDGAAAELLQPPVNVYRLALHPDGVALRIANFDEWARHILHRIHAETLNNPDDRLTRLHAELEGYLPDRPLGPGHLGFAVPVRLRSPEGELNLVTTITTFATAIDITLAELKLETFLPMDESTASILTQRWRRQRMPSA